MKKVLAVLLIACMFATGCSSSWVTVALNDLPVLVQIATSIAGLASVVQTGSQASPAELQAIQNISTQAQGDLTLLQTLYTDYKAQPSASTIAKIEAAIATTQQNLPAMLQAAHIEDAVLQARITAAVNLVLTTVTAVGALIPNASIPATAARVAVPTASQLRQAWSSQVCAGDATCSAMVR